LKTGYILGATPKNQQIGEFVGVTAAALAIGGTLYLLDSAWGFGSDELAAPQATLMKLITEGVMGGNLPWNLVITGVIIAVIVEILGIPVLPFAIGIYLPVHLNTCIMVGGVLRLAFEKLSKNEAEKKALVDNGLLFCSGMIAGEGVVGIILALLAIFGIDNLIDLSEKLNLSQSFMSIGGIVLFLILIILFLFINKTRKGELKSKIQ
jgi:putative OPT family oligopeptide transporter